MENQDLNKKKEFKETLFDKIITNKFTPVILLVFNILLFFYLIPINFAEEYSILLGILGAVITMVLVFWSFGALIPKLSEKFPIFIGIIGVGSLFVFGIYFIAKTSNFSSNELNTNGVYTEALIVDKTKIYGRRGRSIQSIDVNFLTNKKEKVTVKIDVTDKYYRFLRKGTKIPIFYSENYPNIAEIDYRKLRIN